MRRNAAAAEVCSHCARTKSSMTADQSADSMPHADSIHLFLCGDAITGRGIDQVLPHPNNITLHEPCVGDARTYVELAERVNGAIPRPTEFDYIWGDALTELDRADVDCNKTRCQPNDDDRLAGW